MKVTPFTRPLKGERILGVQPPLAPDAQITWRRRLHLFTGRSLSDIALTIEQEGRAGHLATRGQRVSAGVVTGLETALEREITEGGANFYLHFASGYGMAASGEDIVVPWPLRVALQALPVYAPAALLDALETGAPLPVVGDETGALAVRRIGPSLSEVRVAIGEAPMPQPFLAGVVVAQPATLDVRDEVTSDACDDDPSNYAFEDWQRVDGCRLVFYPWPTEWLALPAPGPQWRNRLANAIFEAEAGLTEPSVLPWAEVGVPLCLVGFDNAWSPLFVDRFSVVRAGGKPRRRRGTFTHAGSPFLWQARMQQFAEHLGDPDLAELSAHDAAAQFRFLPPAGLLSKDAVDLTQKRSEFFPHNYQVTAAPAPLEQLDLALESSASLQAFDLFTLDAVEILVPVPQIWYEPRLLQTEVVDPEFQESIDSFAERRGKWLLRRADVREKADAINLAMKAKVIIYPDPDPGRLEEEAVASDPLDPSDPLLAEPETAFGTEVEGDVRVATVFEQLREDLRTQTPLKHQTVEPLAALPAGVSFPTPLSDRVSYDAATDRLTFQGAMTVVERDALLGLSADTAYQTAITQLYQRSQDDELSQLERRGVEEFIKFLEGKVSKADDTLDFGFLRAQTDVYRIRQIMLGTDAATRLATSPALAGIAQGATAKTTREDISRFLETARRAPEEPPTALAPAVPPSTPSSGSSGATPSVGDAVFMNLANFSNLATPTETTRFASRLSISGEQESITPLLAFQVQEGASQLFKSQYTKDEIASQMPVVGKAYDFRTVTIAERLATPAPLEAKSYTVSTKYEVVNGLANLDIAMDDLVIPGFQEDGTDVSRDFLTIKTQNLAGQILAGQHDPDPQDGDEAAFFAAGIRAIDHSVAILRIAEGRVQAYKAAVEMCRAALKSLQDLARQATQRLDVIEDNLAEARHDVAVARALLAEETQRVDSINQRRSQVLAEHVNFLAYRRPRSTDVLRGVPTKAVNPGLTEEPVPACLGRDVVTPPELRDMMDLLKDAPVKWFTHLPAVLNNMNKLDDLKRTFLNAKARAQLATAVPIAKSAAPSGSSLALALNKVFAVQEQVLVQQRLVRTQLDLSKVASLSWLHAKDEAKDVLSLGDLIDANHGRSDVAQQAAQELENIAHVATCLYSLFGEVLPVIRLDWAQRLSQFDDPVNLRNLASLPRWGEIEYLDRKEMQTLVDWLYQRIDARQPDAVALMNDVVRACILLASHAPINQIIAGRLPKPTTAKIGDRVDVSVLTSHLAKVHVGMQALLYSGATVVAKAVVEDLSGGQVTTRIIQAATQTVQLSQDATVHFAEPSAFDRNPLTFQSARRTR